MKRNDCDDFPDTVIIGSSALYPLAKGAIQMLILFVYLGRSVGGHMLVHEQLMDCSRLIQKYKTG